MMIEKPLCFLCPSFIFWSKPRILLYKALKFTHCSLLVATWRCLCIFSEFELTSLGRSPRMVFPPLNVFFVYMRVPTFFVFLYYGDSVPALDNVLNSVFFLMNMICITRLYYYSWQINTFQEIRIFVLL